MNRQQKTEVVELLKDSFSHKQAAFLVNFQGLTVAQLQTLRKELRKSGGSLKVAKARLMKRAVESLKGDDQLAPFFKGQVGIVFASKESPAIAKVLHEYSQKNGALKLIAGCLEDRLLDGASIVRIASLPSREVLLAQVCGTIQAPLTGFVNVLNGVMVQFLWTLKQIGDKKQ